MERDEYAAVIRQAFNAEPVRSISEASTFEDVPEGYWANTAIKDAYEAGFMGTPEADEFEPQTEISRADAIVALVEGIGPDRLLAAAPAETAPAQRTRRQATHQLMFPIAATTIMQLFAPPPQAAPPAAQANGSNPDAGAEVPLDLSKYYADADQIPE
ncbi:S-layer homology domain-containing protein [Leptolyngbya sp. BC1307]|uniref:S-layer homology domain-containing protein n=1 Tax=Leptolyngbya sp. BC1307 TaxID=2029589 RepID=UPI0032046834